MVEYRLVNTEDQSKDNKLKLRENDTLIRDKKKRKFTDDISKSIDELPQSAEQISKQMSLVNGTDMDNHSSTVDKIKNDIVCQEATDIPITATTAENDTAPLVQDPFFVESVIVSEKSLSNEATNRYNKFHTSYNKPRHFIPKHVDTEGLSKQQIRLLEWQTKKGIRSKINR